MIGRSQLDLPMPPPERPAIDFPALARKDLQEALAKAKAAVDRPPWPYRDQRMWRVLGYQMTGWLPPEEAAAFTVEFVAELDRIERQFFAGAEQ